MAPWTWPRSRAARARCLGLLGAVAAATTTAAAPAVASTAFAVSATVVESYITKLVLALSPGLAVAGGAFALYRVKDSQPKHVKYLGGALLLMAALAIPVVMPLDTAKEVVPEIKLKSGEERLLPNGKFVLVSDPRPGSGPAQEGWQQALWTEMAEAIQKGEEQVVMVFTRPGCPWCEKLHPVLDNAIKQRADQLASGTASDDSAMEVAPLLQSKLRIFIYDASEFGPIMRRFGVEGFPTIFFFGPPGSRPQVIPGFLGPKDFEHVLETAANAEIEPERPERGERRGWFR
eukprot:Skav217968  [mRNA]  locus=scaffold3450:296191:317560:- [translate_table: standard]